MDLRFSLTDKVQIRIPAQPHEAATAGMVLEGKVAAAGCRTLRITLDNQEQQSSEFFPALTRCVIRKITPRGMLEFDAIGYSQEPEEERTITVTLLGVHREIQRRDACRIECHCEARYRDLAMNTAGRLSWKAAELHDVSLGGARLLLRNDTLEVGQELLVEFALNDETFSVPAAVRRIEGRRGRNGRLCALQFLELDSRQRGRMAKAIMNLQSKIISSRVKID